MFWLFFTSVLTGCTETVETPPSSNVLFLRKDAPAGASSFPRINRESFDLGGLTLTPPTESETRFCGDVVAFQLQPGAMGEEPIHVREVFYRVWWRSATGRGRLSLWAPGMHGNEANQMVAACEGGIPERDQFFLSTARVPTDFRLGPDALDQLHVLLDVAGAAVDVTTCPAVPSLIVLNPPSDEELMTMDTDQDGISDYDEYFSPEIPDSVECVRRPRETIPIAPLTALPEDLPVFEVSGNEPDTERREISGAHRFEGVMKVVGHLVLRDATLVMTPNSEGLAHIEVTPNGRLEIHDSLVAAGDAARGFTLEVRQGAFFAMTDSEFRHLGRSIGKPSGHVDNIGALIQNDGSIIRGTKFVHSLIGLDIQGTGAVLQGNTFETNGTSIRVRGNDIVIEENTSLRDGVFLNIDSGVKNILVRGNRISHTVDRAIVVRESTADIRILNNEFDTVNTAIYLHGEALPTIEDNTIHYWQLPIGTAGRTSEVPDISEKNSLVVAEKPWSK